MKYGLQCRVTSKIRLSRKQASTWDDLTVELSPNAEGFLSEIVVVAFGHDVGRCDTTVTTNDGVTQVLAVQVQRNEALHVRLLNALQVLESFLCFYGNLENIHWNEAEAFFEIETDGQLGMQRLALQVTPAFYEPDVDLSPEQVDLILAKAGRGRSMATTLSFYREGLIDVRQRRNISAFFNFFFVLEGLYANGKFHGREVKREFARSTVLTNAIQTVIKQGFHQSADGDEGILEWLKRIAKPCDAPGLIHLIVEARGDLHHYSGTKKSKGSPLMNERYLSLSQFTLRLVQAVLPVELEMLDSSA